MLLWLDVLLLRILSMKNSVILIVLFLITYQVFSQEKYLTKEGYISFFSNSLVEDIKADNYQVLSVIDKSNGEIDAIQVKYTGAMEGMPEWWYQCSVNGSGDLYTCANGADVIW